CYACIIPQLPTATFGEIRSSCATVPNQDLAFGGQNGVMILSRHPLKNTENWVIPGTWNRRSILSASVELPSGAELDVYCNHLTPIFDDFVFPYTGQYGDGMTGALGWQAEQELQAEKLVAYVNTTNGDRPSVILGDFNTGLAFPAQGIVGEVEETFDLLAAAFTPAYTSDYAPLCTFCSTNPVTNPDDDPEATSVWIDHILLQNFPADSVLSTARIFDDAVVPVEGDMLVPLSDHFGMRSVIVVP
ncbi:MAG: endonuclease/exonuclease/phosphatase family protein, partial [Deltaproteobacteria bacterium]|nr:endonuclease/exonuclease/phosphatase family protein [Deltaproteobacteria bacterium]